MNGGWAPGIGDPSAIGWLTVAGYLAAAITCVRAARHVRAGGLREWSGLPFWSTLALLMLVLGVNKQLDVQSLFTQMMRDAAKVQGWYAHRRTLQAAFIFAITVGGVSAATILATRLRTLHRSNVIALVGLAVVYTYVVVRAASFHHVDLLINHEILGFRLSVLVELCGILLVCRGSVMRLHVSAVSERHSGPPCRDRQPRA